MGRIREIIVITITVLLLGGCFYLWYLIKNKPEETTVPVTESEYGDYAESDITLPALDTDNGERIVNLVYNKGKDRIELYTEIYNDESSNISGYKEYLLNTSDNSWTENAPDFLGLPEFVSTSMVISDMEYSDNNNLYILLTDINNDPSVPDQIVRILSDSGTLDNVGVKGIYKTDSDGAPIKIMHFCLSGKKIIITDSLDNIYAYDLDSGKLLASAPGYVNNTACADTNYLYSINDNFNTIVKTPLDGSSTETSVSSPLASAKSSAGSASINSINLWTHTSDEKSDITKSEAFDFRLTFSPGCEAGSIILSCEDGIFGYSEESSSFTELVSGTDCLFGKPSVVQDKFIVAGNVFYALSGNSAGEHFITTYKKPLKSEETVKKDFIISSYKRNPLVKEAVVELARKNKNLNIIYSPATDDNPDLSISDYRDITNKSFKNGTAGDIIVCDDLEMNTLISSKYLLGISQYILPLVAADGLFSNLAKPFTDHQIYAMPAGFTSYMYYGNSSTVSQTASLKSMKDYCNTDSTKIFRSSGFFSISSLIANFYCDSYTDGNKINDALLSDTISSFDQISDSFPDASTDLDATFSRLVSADNAASIDDLRIAELNDAESLYDMISLSENGCSFSSVNSIYKPYALIAVNASTSNVAAVNSFLNIIFSGSVQSSCAMPVLSVSEDVLDSEINRYALTLNDSNSDSDNAPSVDTSSLKNVLSSLENAYTDNDTLYNGLCTYLELYCSGDIDMDSLIKKIKDYKIDTNDFSTYAPSKNKNTKILIIGSDAISSGTASLDTSLSDAADEYGLNVTVTSCIHSDTNLYDQKKYLDDKNYETYDNLRTADIIIVSDNSAAAEGALTTLYDINTNKKKDAIIYYLITDAEKSVPVMHRFSSMAISYIPLYKVHSALRENDATSFEAISTNTGTNALMTYIDSLTVIRSIFGTDITAVHESLINDSIKNMTSGKNDNTDAVLKDISEIITECLEKFYGG